MAIRNVSTDELPLEIWQSLSELGLRGSRIYVKLSHPDMPAEKATQTVMDAVTARIIELHFAKKPILKKALQEEFMASESLVDKAVRRAKEQLGLGSEFRYSKFEGGFVRRSKMKTAMEKRARVSRPNRNIVRPKKGSGLGLTVGGKAGRNMPGFERPVRRISPSDLERVED